MWQKFKPFLVPIINITLLVGLGLFVISAYIYISAPVLELRGKVSYNPLHSEDLRTTGLENPELTSIYNVSPYFILAVLMQEDNFFFRHSGIDLFQLRLAIWDHLFKGKPLRGASTISQQLIKNVFLSGERSIVRKWIEAVYTKKLEANFSKVEILTLYFDILELGDGIFGVEQASKYYFRKSAGSLTLNESAILAFIAASPKKRPSRLRPPLPKDRPRRPSLSAKRRRAPPRSSRPRSKVARCAPSRSTMPFSSSTSRRGCC